MVYGKSKHVQNQKDFKMYFQICFFFLAKRFLNYSESWASRIIESYQKKPQKTDM